MTTQEYAVRPQPLLPLPLPLPSSRPTLAVVVFVIGILVVVFILFFFFCYKIEQASLLLSRWLSLSCFLFITLAVIVVVVDAIYSLCYLFFFFGDDIVTFLFMMCKIVDEMLVANQKKHRIVCPSPSISRHSRARYFWQSAFVQVTCTNFLHYMYNTRLQV